MKQYFALVEKEKSQFVHFSIQRVPRRGNEEADRLAKLAISTIEDLTPGIFVEHLLEPSIKVREEREINVVSLEPKWASQITRFLRRGELPDDKEEARRVKVRASRYLFVDDTLYKMSFTLLLLWCLSEEEADYMLREIHEGICGSHSEGRAMAYRAIRDGYYWASMKRDATLLA